MGFILGCMNRHEILRIERLETLHDLFRHAVRQQPRWLAVDVVTQDELTSDVILRTGEGEYVVFDASPAGRIHGFTVWDHQPSAAELLERRLATGWTPTPSPVQGGPRILGYAACLSA